ncbi:MAG TPA: SUMF1/EgtB/PvdO family nonheme iron enzyme [Solirubrobacteraceae bacterium]|nr:SUMF1/EgtB/PvdO family nonheme iron enzyme [Solirubrobacteraceae bacterium]
MASTATAKPKIAAMPSRGDALDALGEVRRQTLALVRGLDGEQLTSVYSPIMSPLVWDLGHIAAYEDLWLAHRQAGLALLKPELADVYDAFETPRAVRGDVAALGPEQAFAYMRSVRERTERALELGEIDDGQIFEMVLRHELQHCETMRQTMAIAGLLPETGTLAETGIRAEGACLPASAGGACLPASVAGEPQITEAPAAADMANGSAGTPSHRSRQPGWARIPAGEFAMGAGEEGFAYDNERPLHTVVLGAFEIAERPVSNASWMRFSEGGGYERREWWSDEGWAWKQQDDITHHPAVAAGAPGAPACHVSWFEAEAFARAHEARLPSEAEWERAASYEHSPLRDRGAVWEWTSSSFGGYPGFVAYPYREYSEVFFGERYRVLRGGSWATSPRVKTTTFRNWDLPERRQIFAGVRLARDRA